MAFNVDENMKHFVSPSLLFGTKNHESPVSSAPGNSLVVRQLSVSVEYVNKIYAVPRRLYFCYLRTNRLSSCRFGRTAKF